MRKILPFSLLLVCAVSAMAQQSGSTTFENRCSLCHGGDGSGGGRAPSLLGFVRYHTDSEVSSLIHSGRLDKGMPTFDLSEIEMHDLLAHLRSLAGSNPAMAQAGYTGNAPMKVPGRKPLPGPHPGLLKLASGETLEGTVIESDFSAEVLTDDGKYHLLSHEGDQYREKPVEPKRDWTSYNGSFSGNRYSTLSQINTGNVKQLSLAWLFPAASTRVETTPIVADGVMYITGWNEAYALDATTGQQLWIYRQPHTTGLVSEASRGANRGMAISNDKLFMVTDNAHLLALDRRNGQKLWDVEMGSVKDGYSATGAPLVVGDLVVVGISGGEEGARGYVTAYKAGTGEQVWRFYTVPKRGEKGSETWIGNAIEHGCGATWLTGSYDPQLDIVYWGTGNPCPDYNGDERKGDNLYASSVVALSAKTGELKWYYQFTPHDTHDWDSEEPLLLVDQVWKGQPRKLLLHADRNGFFFVLDRATGEFLMAEPFGKVTWASGYDKSGRPILTDTHEPTVQGTVICPAENGASNWYSASWSPITNLFYVRSTDWCSLYKKQSDPLVENRWYGGVAPNQPGGQNFIRALKSDNGQKAWEFPLTTFGRGGVLSTAGGVVFVGGSAGAFVALDAKTGKAIWHLSLGQDWQASPMTYMVGGRQFIAIAGPAGIFTFSLNADSLNTDKF
jgi:alcohol dehydrogenase (cytochrome c)